MARRDWGKIARKGKRFYAEYTGPDGRRHTPGHSFPHRGDAEGWLAQERRLIDLKAWQPPRERTRAHQAGSITVGEWLDQFHDLLMLGPKPLKTTTQQNYLKVTRLRITKPVPPGDTVRDIARLKNLQLADLTKGDVYRWWDAVQRTYPDTAPVNRQAYQRLRAAMAEAVRRGMMQDNPVAIREAARPVKAKDKYLPSDEEIAAILKAMPGRYKALTSMVLHHGLRLGEALAITVNDVVVEWLPAPLLPRITLRVTKNVERITDGERPSYMLLQETPKTSAGVRDVPVMSADVPLYLEHLRCYVAPPTTVESKSGPTLVHLFTTTTQGRAVMDTTYREALNRAEDRAGVTREINPHCGRNWLITRLAEQGAHLKEIGALLGQDDVSTILDVYMKVRAGRTDTLMERVNRSLG